MGKVPDRFAEDVFVVRSGEEAVQQLVIVDGFGDESSDKLEVGEVVGVDVGLGVDHVGDTITGRRLEEGVVGVEDLSGDDRVPFPQQTTGVLPFFPIEHDVKATLPVFRWLPMQVYHK